MQQHAIPTPAMKNENGFVLVGALLILLLVVLIGISATTSSILELHISGADRIHTETFFQADSGIQLAALLIEENMAVSDTGGFRALDGAVLRDPDAAENNDRVEVIDPNFWAIAGPRGEAPDPRNAGAPVITYRPDPADAALRADITVSGFTETVGGSGQTFGGGYGDGGGMAQEQIIFAIRSLYTGKSQSETEIGAVWRHMVGQEGHPRL